MIALVLSSNIGSPCYSVKVINLFSMSNTSKSTQFRLIRSHLIKVFYRAPKLFAGVPPSIQ